MPVSGSTQQQQQQHWVQEAVIGLLAQAARKTSTFPFSCSLLFSHPRKFLLNTETVATTTSDLGPDCFGKTSTMQNAMKWLMASLISAIWSNLLPALSSISEGELSNILFVAQNSSPAVNQCCSAAVVGGASLMDLMTDDSCSLAHPPLLRRKSYYLFPTASTWSPSTRITKWWFTVPSVLMKITQSELFSIFSTHELWPMTATSLIPRILSSNHWKIIFISFFWINDCSVDSTTVGWWMKSHYFFLVKTQPCHSLSLRTPPQPHTPTHPIPILSDEKHYWRP